MNKNIPFRAINYQWETLLYSPEIEPKRNFENKFGYRVLERENEEASLIQFMVYTKNIDKDIFLVGNFNNWGKCENLKDYKLEKEDNFSQIKISQIKHKEPYAYLVDNKFLRDPATVFFDEKGNSVFWDFENPSTYKLKNSKPERVHRATKIIQTDVLGLVARWFEYDKKSKSLADSEEDLFTYITNCGVLEKIKESGFNTIQFLPLAQSIDGDNWKYRYLVSYPFAIHKSFGDPDSFLKLIDKCHELNIAVILDVIISHCPYKDFKLFEYNGEDIGLHKWDEFGDSIYLNEKTHWGTKRYNYGDKNIREFLEESCNLFLTKYFVDGFRIDNVDGILRYGDSGEGDERPHGRLFLQKLIQNIYDYDPYTLIHLESHYFHGENAKELVSPISLNKRSLGATAYSGSRLTYFLHSEYMLKSAKDLTIWKLEYIRNDKEKSKSNSTISDFHNHDAAAGLMYGRATGSYAFDAMTLKNDSLNKHAIGKIKIMEALISFGTEGRILDILQTFLLQKGTFEHDSSIHWDKLNSIESKEVINYKKKINEILEEPAFWPENTINREFVNVDDVNKILVIKRKDTTQNTDAIYYILLNFAGAEIRDYSFGVEEEESFEIIYDSYNNLNGEQVMPTQSTNFELFDKEINLPSIKAYNIIIIKKLMS